MKLALIAVVVLAFLALTRKAGSSSMGAAGASAPAPVPMPVLSGIQGPLVSAEVTPGTDEPTGGSWRDLVAKGATYEAPIFRYGGGPGGGGSFSVGKISVDSIYYTGGGELGFEGPPMYA